MINTKHGDFRKYLPRFAHYKPSLSGMRVGVLNVIQLHNLIPKMLNSEANLNEENSAITGNARRTLVSIMIQTRALPSKYSFTVVQQGYQRRSGGGFRRWESHTVRQSAQQCLFQMSTFLGKRSFPKGREYDRKWSLFLNGSGGGTNITPFTNHILTSSSTLRKTSRSKSLKHGYGDKHTNRTIGYDRHSPAYRQ